MHYQSTLSFLGTCQAMISLLSLREYSWISPEEILSNEIDRLTFPTTHDATFTVMSLDDLQRNFFRAKYKSYITRSISLAIGKDYKNLTLLSKTAKINYWQRRQHQCTVFHRRNQSVAGCPDPSTHWMRWRRRKRSDTGGARDENNNDLTGPQAAGHLASAQQAIVGCFDNFYSSVIQPVKKAAPSFKFIAQTFGSVYGMLLTAEETYRLFYHLPQEYKNSQAQYNDTDESIKTRRFENAKHQREHDFYQENEEMFKQIDQFTLKTRWNEARKAELDSQRELDKSMQFWQTPSTPVLFPLDNSINTYFRSYKVSFLRVRDFRTALQAWIATYPDDNIMQKRMPFKHKQIITGLINYALNNYNCSLETQRNSTHIVLYILKIPNIDYEAKILPRFIDPDPDLQSDDPEKIYNLMHDFDPDMETDSFGDQHTKVTAVYDATSFKMAHYFIPTKDPYFAGKTIFDFDHKREHLAFQVKAVLAYAETQWYTRNTEQNWNPYFPYHVLDNVKFYYPNLKITNDSIKFVRTVFTFDSQEYCKKIFKPFLDLIDPINNIHAMDGTDFHMPISKMANPRILKYLSNFPSFVLKGTNFCGCKCDSADWLDGPIPTYKNSFNSDCVCVDRTSYLVMQTLKQIEISQASDLFDFLKPKESPQSRKGRSSNTHTFSVTDLLSPNNMEAKFPVVLDHIDEAIRAWGDSFLLSRETLELTYRKSFDPRRECARENCKIVMAPSEYYNELIDLYNSTHCYFVSSIKSHLISAGKI